MAWKAFTADEIEEVAANLESVAIRLRNVAKEVRSKPLSELYLQAETAFASYCRVLDKIADEAPSEIKNQFKCKQTGEIPRWQISQRAVAARKARKAAKLANDAATGRAPTAAVKKTASRPRKKG